MPHPLPRPAMAARPAAFTPWSTCLAVLLALQLWSPSRAAAASRPPETSAELVLYRCGPQGRELRNTPCPAEAGASQVLHFDADDADAAQAARERVRQEGLLTERMRREREALLQAEQQASGGVLMNARSPAPPASSTAHAEAPSHRTARSRASRSPQASPRHHRPHEKPPAGTAPSAPGTTKGSKQ